MDEIQNLLQDAVGRAYPEYNDIKLELTMPEAQFGDYASNIALQLGKKQGKNPREIAQEIIDNIPKNSIIERAEIAGPGFINIVLKDNKLREFLNRVIQNKLTSPKEFKQKTVVVETNNPNPFKAMHIGHAFNAILGDTIANLLELNGAKAHRVSYHGDVGAHVGKSMYSLLKFVNNDPQKLEGIPKNERNTFMSKMYAEGAKAYKDDPQAKKEIDKLSEESFEPKDKIYRQVYETCRAWSFEQIDELVAQLGNKPTQKRYLESKAEELGVKIVNQYEGKVFIRSQGALVFPGEKYGSFDNVFVGSNGRGLYGARDLGLIQLKQQDFDPDYSYIITAEEQKNYFVGVIKAAKLCFLESKDTTINIPHGTVKLSTGKMSSRDGDVLEVAWLFDKIRQAIKARGGVDNDEVVQGALRYQFLKVRIGSDVVFDVDQSVSLDGNTGPYLQYAHARACSILANKTNKPPKLYNTEFTEQERTLLRKLHQYPDIEIRAARELMPHYICTYLFELAQEFNRFYEKNRVIGDDRQAIRLTLLSGYVGILKRGLEVLGIPAPQKM